MGGVMLWVAVAGLAVNILAFWVLTRGEGENLNVRSAALHVAGDLLGSVPAIVAAVVILWAGWTPIDPILSILVVVIILRSAWKVVRESGHMLLGGAPADFDVREVTADLTQNVPGVVRIHHVHAWSITQERPMVTLEAEVEPDANPQVVRRAVKSRLFSRFGVEHATVEIQEAGGSEELSAATTTTLEVAP